MEGAPPPPDRNSLILALARDNRAADLQKAIKAGIPVSYANRMGQTAMHVAALWGHLEAITVLLANGADANQTNSRGTTPLHFAAAAKSNALAVCQLLLQHGADPNQADLFGYLPYEQADSPEVRVLLGGPDQRLFDYAAGGRVEELGQLLASGAVRSLKVVDSDGQHALNMAVRNKQDAMVQALLRIDPALGILPDMTANTPLHWACETGNIQLVQQLLPLKPELNMQNLNQNEYSAGNWMAKDEVIMPLDKAPIHLAVEAGAADIVQLLLAAGAKPNLCDYDGASPLHLAVELQDEECLEALLAGGANPSQPNKDVTSALHAVAQRGPLRLLQLLLDHKADVHAADGQGTTPLHLAARCGSAQKVQCLLAAGAPHNAANSHGNTPLHLAAVNGHAKVVELLLAAGADTSLPNKDGRTPAAMAKTPELQAQLTSSS
eukprot:GHRQ01008280.1.p1 GENE.GHRQ01008280.1~~GHRQ01008280.1.p1  ORF type:complete len:485 (+),score=219.30 GHRQ01008280.1:147-1457(+)